MLFLHVTSVAPRDTPLADEKYPRLLLEKGFTGFPTLCFMDADGDVLMVQPGDQRTVAAFEASLARAKRFADILARGDAAAPADRKEVFLSQLRDGVIAGPDIQPRADAVPLDDPEKAYVSARLVDVEAKAILRKFRENGKEKTGELLAALLAAGKDPSDQVDVMFWFLVKDHATTAKDTALEKRATGVIEQRFRKVQELLDKQQRASAGAAKK